MEMTKATFRKLLILILFAILSYLVLSHLGELWSLTGDFINLMTPVILGLVIAYILNVPMAAIERHLFVHPFYLPKERWYPQHKLRRALKRPISLLLSLCIVFAAIAVLVFVVIPALVKTIGELVFSIPGFLYRVQNWANKIFENNEHVNRLLREVELNWQGVFDGVFQFVRHGAGALLQNTLTATTSVLSVVTQFLVSLILAIYILLSKEELRRQMFKLMHAVLSRRTISRILPVLSLANRTFSSYISGQFLEACILGGLTFIGMTILRLPLAPVITVLVILMAMIPIVGAFISGGVACLLILTQSPTKALIWLIFFLVLQQIESNLIYPHVVGKSVKLPGLWVLIAITAGGSLAGMLGMLISIPTFSVLYTLISRWATQRIQARRQAQRVSWFASQGGLLDRMAGSTAKVAVQQSPSERTAVVVGETDEEVVAAMVQTPDPQQTQQDAQKIAQSIEANLGAQSS